MRFFKYFVICLIVFSYFSQSAAQDTSQVALESTIKVYTEIGSKQVSLNRNLKFTVRVEWMGDLSRYKISELENPVINNFDIYSTSSADRRMSEGGVAKAAKIYEFILRPKNLGMGYVESVVVKYIDTQTGEGHSLVTNRLDIEVIESVPDPNSHGWMMTLLPFIVAVCFIFVLVGSWLWKRKKKKREESEIVEVVPLEQEFLTMLHESIALNSPDLNIKENFGSLSKILRKYLTQKYEIAAMELTSDQLIISLKKAQLHENVINNIEEILRVCDLAKFAGSEGDRNDLDRIYTLIEEILEKNLAENNLEEQQDSENAQRDKL